MSIKTSQNFELGFAQTYPDFTKKLVEQCDTLSFQEVRICMCIKLSYTNLQIEKQLNISSSTLSNMRSSIRKKMGLSRSQNLVTTIIKI
ncbi:MAG: hypothetical protein CBC28_07335 [Flavobacteriaceae bacterium TMED68]|nr:MAG: hypothetical protein CBC28_07335 [Flavobacteriaceae bacterium TMED68]